MIKFFFVLLLVIIIFNWNNILYLFKEETKFNYYLNNKFQDFKFKKDQKYFVWQIDKKEFAQYNNLNIKYLKQIMKFDKTYNLEEIINNDPELIKMRNECLNYPDKNFYLKFEQEDNITEYRKLKKYNNKWNYFSNYLISNELNEKSQISKELYKNDKIILSGIFYYPPGSFREWHTNSNTPGYRLYYINALEPNKSFLNFIHPISGEIISVPDRKECINLFMIPEPDEYFWHNITSETHRISVGIRICDNKIINDIKNLAKYKY